MKTLPVIYIYYHDKLHSTPIINGTVENATSIMYNMMLNELSLSIAEWMVDREDREHQEKLDNGDLLSSDPIVLYLFNKYCHLLDYNKFEIHECSVIEPE